MCSWDWDEGRIFVTPQRAFGGDRLAKAVWKQKVDPFEAGPCYPAIQMSLVLTPYAASDRLVSSIHGLLPLGA